MRTAKDKALDRVAVLLALNTIDHRESAHQNRNLIDNARNGENLNIETASTLGILDLYQGKVDFHAPRLFYEL